MMRISVFVAACGFFLATPAAAETLNNQAIVSLSVAGLGDEAIVAKIKTSTGIYALSTEQIIALKQQGVSGPVIAAMLASMTPVAGPVVYSMTSTDPMVPHPIGVYLLRDKSGASFATRIDATVSNQAKTGGILGYALTGGIASMSIKAAIPGDAARATADTRHPTFLMFFDESNPDSARQVTTFASGSSSTVTSPNEFTLIQLTQKKGRREARVGSLNIGGAKTGVMDKDQIAFDYEMVRPGVFRVLPKSDLAPGQYGFIFAFGGSGTNGALTARIFDFAIP